MQMQLPCLVVSSLRVSSTIDMNFTMHKETPKLILMKAALLGKVIKNTNSKTGQEIQLTNGSMSNGKTWRMNTLLYG